MVVCTYFLYPVTDSGRGGAKLKTVTPPTIPELYRNVPDRLERVLVGAGRPLVGGGGAWAGLRRRRGRYCPLTLSGDVTAAAEWLARPSTPVGAWLLC